MNEKFGFLCLHHSASSLSTDTAPNTSSPTRTVRLPDRMQFHRCNFVLFADAACSVQMWVLEEDIGVWFPVSGVLTLAATAPTVVDGTAMPLALVFLQLVSNGGGAKNVGFQFN